MTKTKRGVGIVAFAALLTVASGCSFFGLRPDNVANAPTAQAKFYAAKYEYGKLLVYVNTYAAQPTADPRIVTTFRQIDLRVQAYEQAAKVAIDAGLVDTANANTELILAATKLIRSELIRLGVVDAVGG